MEIERKFQIDLTSLPFALNDYPSSVIEQGYLAVSKVDDREVRLRKRNGEFSLAVKTGQGRMRGEGEVPLSAEQFQTLWPFTDGQRIKKTRYAIPLGELSAELDVYLGRHSGLAVVEVEFPGEAAADNFKPPHWFGDEVTQNATYKNQQLALHGLPW
ncbi:CYTH domain-containing protein [Chromatocurvus halotolerans]|uniref:CYTH domain-containing protein n=1 Tax=Chromatocurvus halotolerans TaxID=1132028 RepID=A0A4R2KX71_9GAMM|nr:CYTH domain-containing protein [Chromatocurvus halotolerans]TCO75856.1 CYTH domain-containing protein [Chromatocurvus halotolerans]